MGPRDRDGFHRVADAKASLRPQRARNRRRMPHATFPVGCMTIRELGRREAAERRLFRNDRIVRRLLISLHEKLIRKY